MQARDIKQMIRNAVGSVRTALRGNVLRASGDKRVVLLQADGLATETFNDAEMFQQPGFRSIPLEGMQPIIVALNGASANGVVVAVSNGALFIADLQPGEVAVFNENDGIANSIILRNGKVIDITCDTLNIKAATKVNVTAPAADIAVSGAITSSGASWSHTGPMELDGALTVTGTATVQTSVSTPSISVG